MCDCCIYDSGSVSIFYVMVRSVALSKSFKCYVGHVDSSICDICVEYRHS